MSISKTVRATLCGAILSIGLVATPAYADQDESTDTSAGTVELSQTETYGVSYAEPRLGPVLPFKSVPQTPHVSDGMASGHGCWKTTNTELKATTAKVTVRLQQFNGNTSSWTTKKKAVKTVYQGCGGGKDAVAKVACKSSGTRLWRTQVDVNVTGYIDDPLKFTKEAYIKCTV